MMKKVLLVISIVAVASLSKAQTYYTLKAGVWEDNTAVWSTQNGGAPCGCNPGISIVDKTFVGINNTVASTSLSSMSDSTFLSIGANDTLVITRGTPFINFTVSQNARILVNGTLIVRGNFNITGNSRIVQANGGSIIVYGNMSYSGNALIIGENINVYGHASKSDHALVSGKLYQIDVATGVKTLMNFNK